MKGTPIFVVIAGIIAVIILLCTHTVKEWEPVSYTHLTLPTTPYV